MQGPEPVLLMTRPRAQAERFVAQLQDLGTRCQVIYSPLMEIRFIGALPDLPDLRGVLFTSANGVAAWQAAGGRSDLPAYCVGEKTAQAARAAGHPAQSAGGNAESLLQMLLGTQPDGPLLHIRGTHGTGDLARRLSAHGLLCHQTILYDQPAQALNAAAQRALKGSDPVVAPVFSPRTARLLAQNMVKAPLLVAGISQAVAKALAPLHICDLRIAPRPESCAMQQLTLDLLRSAAGQGREGDLDRRTGEDREPDLKG